MEKSFNDHSVIANEPSQVSKLMHIRIFCHIKSHHCQDVALDLILAPSKRNGTLHGIQFLAISSGKLILDSKSHQLGID